jgi:hypothetical protein
MRGLLERGEEQEEEEAKTRRRQSLLSAYTGVLRGFADRRDFKHARRVVDMLVQHLGYAEGGGEGEANARADAVLRYLRDLEAEGSRANMHSFVEVDDDREQQQRYLYRFLKERSPEVSLQTGFSFAAIYTLPSLLEGGAFFPCIFCVEIHEEC